MTIYWRDNILSQTTIKDADQTAAQKTRLSAIILVLVTPYRILSIDSRALPSNTPLLFNRERSKENIHLHFTTDMA